MPPRRKPLRPRTWRRGPDPEYSVLTKGRRSASRRQSRFSPLRLPPKEPEVSPLQQIPTLRPWLAARNAAMDQNFTGAAN